MDKWLAAIAVFILLICSLLLFEDLRVIDLGWRKKPKGQVVGRILSTYNHVKQRSSGEILWNATSGDDTVALQDSVLTLSDSRVELELFGNSKLELSENTLIVIEPVENGKDGELRLRLSRGSVGGKTKSNTSALAAGEFELTLSSEASFTLRSTDEDDFQFDLQEGQASVKTQNGVEQIDRPTAVSLGEGGFERIKFDASLSWGERANIRVYSHLGRATAPLAWTGSAKAIRIDSNKTKRTVPVSGQLTNVELPLGTHFLRLESENGAVSQLAKVEIQRAPILHLYSPLPRERVERSQEVSFSWRTFPDLVEYKVDLSSDSGFEDVIKTWTTSSSSVTTRFEHIGGFYWRVRGIDRNGTEVPALYSNEIFFVENPFEAPGVSEPRKPSSSQQKIRMPFWSQSVLWQLYSVFVGSAEAKAPRIAEFRWKTVPKATRYVLEVDDDPYFQSPEIIETTQQAKFSWHGHPLTTVYWRVAADSSGRMGLFSPVQKVDLRTLSTAPSNDEYAVSAKEPPAPVVAAVEETPRLPQSAEVIPEPINRKKDPLPTPRGLIAWRPSYFNQSFSSSEIERVSVTGIGVLGGSIDLLWTDHFRTLVESQYIQWKLKEKATAAFQKDLEVLEFSGHALWGLDDREWWFGPTLRRSAGIKRTGREAFETEDIWSYGARVEWHQHTKNWWWLSDGSLRIGAGGFSADVGFSVRSHFSELQGAFFGGEVRFRYSNMATQSQETMFLLPIGYEW